jgi:hypothetical protein
MHANGAITRTTDGGKSWTSFPIADSVGAIHSMSSLTRDTIYASGSSGAHRMLRSTDRGASWSLDSVLLDTAYEFVAANGLTVMADGHPVGLFSQSSYDVDPSAIFRGEWEPARVEIYERIFYGTHLYPNPATTEFTITSVDPSRPVHVFDMIGRELLHDVLDTRGVATLDISRLPRGVYSVVLDHYGKLLPVGKVAVVGR